MEKGFDFPKYIIDLENLRCPTGVFCHNNNNIRVVTELPHMTYRCWLLFKQNTMIECTIRIKLKFDDAAFFSI